MTPHRTCKSRSMVTAITIRSPLVGTDRTDPSSRICPLEPLPDRSSGPIPPSRICPPDPLPDRSSGPIPFRGSVRRTLVRTDPPDRSLFRGSVRRSLFRTNPPVPSLFRGSVRRTLFRTDPPDRSLFRGSVRRTGYFRGLCNSRCWPAAGREQRRKNTQFIVCSRSNMVVPTALRFWRLSLRFC